MIDLDIPGFGRHQLAELVCDFNGTLARDGRLLDDVRALLVAVAKLVHVHVVTADTFGTARDQLSGLPCDVAVLDSGDQALAKAAYVERLGASSVVAMGNGRNDRLMLTSAALGIGVIGDEGIAGEALSACDIVARNIGDALGLLLEPRRVIASLRD
jgi:soluble P-type ATPase